MMLLAAILLNFASAQVVTAPAAPDSGEYLVRSAGCADCHTADLDRPMAGRIRLDSPFGSFYTPNISPDKKTGIGSWTLQQFQDALRSGRSPGGTLYYPAFPYRSFSKMTDSDIEKIFWYLRSLPATSQVNRPNDLGHYDQRWLLHFWQTFYFGSWSSSPEIQIRQGVGPFTADVKQSASWNRGAYLVEAVFHCTECHTPRDYGAGLYTKLWMSGSDFGGLNAPNITPDPQTGRGKWTRAEWTRFLASGLDPQNKTPKAEMADVIQNTSALTAQDREAIVTYMLSLPAIHRWSSP
jgi:mono/diheme cytochrome c family protein